MNEQLKKRLIGATVLVAAAVIVVPMIFNGGEQTEMPTFGSNVPPRPDGQFQTIEVPLQTPPAPVVENQPVDNTKEAAAIETQAAAAPAASPSDPVPAPPPVVATPVPTPPKATAPPKASAPTAPAPATATRPVSGWAVQLGSFSSSANALSLRDKLRKKGFAAYVEHQKSSGYRVRVGPELKRDNADALKAKLEKAGFKGVVMPHP